jgi:tRNA threonylcarbamoyl adenosine modification protein YeaZ
MKILYLDTSSSFLYTAIIENNILVAEIKEKLDKDLSSEALPRISGMFEKTEIKPTEIDKIIVVNGPGSFTGVRIGLTIAKTFAWAREIPIIQILSLEAMALSYTNKNHKYIVPAIDARRNYVFAAIYDVEQETFVMKEQYINLNTLEIALENLPGNHCYLSNDKLNTNSEIIEYSPEILNIVEQSKKREAINPHAVDANYLKLTEAEEKNDTNA